jgi:energy-coupling factor transporter transmembrane protein EcfT
MLTSIKVWLDVLEEWPSSIAIRESIYGYTALLSLHVVGMCLFLGLVLMMDLRLMGIANMRSPFSQLQRRLFPWQMAGMLLSAVTGVVLIYGQPSRFYSNIFFWVKMLMMALAMVNAMAFHQSTYHTVVNWDSRGLPPLGAKLSGVLSVALWAGVVVAGRMIAYNWFAAGR